MKAGSRRSSLSRRRSSLSRSSRRAESLQLEDSSAGPLLQPPSSLQPPKRPVKICEDYMGNFRPPVVICTAPGNSVIIGIPPRSSIIIQPAPGTPVIIHAPPGTPVIIHAPPGTPVIIHAPPGTPIVVCITPGRPLIISTSSPWPPVLVHSTSRASIIIHATPGNPLIVWFKRRLSLFIIPQTPWSILISSVRPLLIPPFSTSPIPTLFNLLSHDEIWIQFFKAASESHYITYLQVTVSGCIYYSPFQLESINKRNQRSQTRKLNALINLCHLHKKHK
ncbi:hypothetical protein MC885_017574, partial [Smutsia gigantea]